MVARKPAEPNPDRSELIGLIRWVLSSWSRVWRVAVLVITPIVAILIFAGVAATVIFYLKVNPQRWGAVAGLGVITAGAAKAIYLVRGWLDRRRTSAAPEGLPTGSQEITGAEGTAGATGDNQGDDNLGK
ncbi:hypothetical protein [Actinoplanes sp. NPDC026619]|uniref:hypothetical protein n=1 Tax=Actinoplanes sp. NPDC026619 TaxID=3155798 RepID=UPI0033E40D5E